MYDPFFGFHTKLVNGTIMVTIVAEHYWNQEKLKMEKPKMIIDLVKKRRGGVETSK